MEVGALGLREQTALETRTEQPLRNKMRQIVVHRLDLIVTGSKWAVGKLRTMRII